MNEVLENRSQKYCKSLYEILKRHLLSARFLNNMSFIFLINQKIIKIEKIFNQNSNEENFKVL
jgi:hypothetical protein